MSEVASTCTVCRRRPARPDRHWPEVTALCRPCMTSLFWAMCKARDADGERAPFNFNALIAWASERVRKIAKESRAVERGELEAGSAS